MTKNSVTDLIYLVFINIIDGSNRKQFGELFTLVSSYIFTRFCVEFAKLSPHEQRGLGGMTNSSCD